MGVSRVELGDETLIDLTEDSVTPQTLMLGATAHNRAGDEIVGEFDPSIFQTKEDESLNTEDKNVVNAINGLNTNVAKLLQWYDKENYVEMVASITPKTSTFELGSTNSLTFKWTFKVGEETAKLSKLKFINSERDVTLTSATVYNITSAGEYVVEGTRADGKNETATAKANVYFYNKYYFGCDVDPQISPTSSTKDKEYSDFIKGSNGRDGLYMKSGWASVKPTFTYTPNCPEGSYIWYAYPKRLGASTFKMNGLPADFNVQTVMFTNITEKYSEEYYLYRSIEPSLGSIEIQIL